MKCPRCDSAVLDERTRDGVVIDACPECRGVWLDRGELEKLIARATRDVEEWERDPRYAGGDRNYDRDHDRDDDDDRRRHGGRRRGGFLGSLGDLFD